MLAARQALPAAPKCGKCQRSGLLARRDKSAESAVLRGAARLSDKSPIPPPSNPGGDRWTGREGGLHASVWTPPALAAEEAPRHYRLIACDVLNRELHACIAQCRPIVDADFQPKGLHDIGSEAMAARLQEAIHRIEPATTDAILLGYGLCSNGIVGLRAPVPMVVPRVHDCISLLLGSRVGYQVYFEQNPGTYFLSPGWVERAWESANDPQSIPSQLRMTGTYQEYLEQYGEDNARYLVETLGGWMKQYRKLAYIDTHTGDFQPYKEWSRRQARERGWEYEELTGDVGLLLRLLSGAWEDADFLVVPPGETIAPSHDGQIVRSVR